MLPHDDSGQLVVGTKNWLTLVPCGPWTWNRSQGSYIVSPRSINILPMQSCIDNHAAN